MNRSSEKLIYRKAKASDLQRLQDLEQRIIESERPFNSFIKSENATYYDIKELLSNNKSHVIVAEDNSKIIGTGYAQLRLSKSYFKHTIHSYLGFMYTSPQYRGKGINGEILKLLISWSQEQGVNDFYLKVYSGNTAAIKAYEKINFKPCLLEMKLNL